ncbi:MAG TPA: hypothetical protein PLM79_18065, partial [Syntrophobacteraceae bacterium]|nr:hypothetical protein [Syntrophobacteraceae bacterium]
AVHPTDPKVLLAATHPEQWPHMLFESRDGGRSWKLLQEFNLSPTAPSNWARTLNGPEKIVFSPGGDRVYLADWWNLWERSGEEGPWTQLHHGLQNSVVNDIRVDPRDPRRWLVCAADSGVMVSQDAGKTWTRKMNGVADGHAQALDFSRRDPRKMFLVTNPWSKKGRIHVYRTADGGETWQDVGFPMPSNPLASLGFADGSASGVAADPVRDEVAYVTTNGYGIFKTVNGGKTWDAVNEGLATPYVKGPRSLLIHPKTPDVLWVSTQKGGVYKSVNGAKSWRLVSPQGPFCFGMAVDPSNPSRVLAACAEKKVLLSEDEGNSWTEILLPGERPSHVAAYSLAFHPESPGCVFAGTLAYDLKAAHGLFHSRDGGRSFRPCALPLPPVNLNVLEAIPGLGCPVLLGFNGIGIYQGRGD